MPWWSWTWQHFHLKDLGFMFWVLSFFVTCCLASGCAHTRHSRLVLHPGTFIHLRLYSHSTTPTVCPNFSNLLSFTGFVSPSASNTAFWKALIKDREVHDFIGFVKITSTSEQVLRLMQLWVDPRATGHVAWSHNVIWFGFGCQVCTKFPHHQWKVKR